MRTIRRHKLLVALAAAGFMIPLLAGVLSGYLAGTARATGIPSTDPLFYSGVLADTTGKLITGSKSIGVSLYTTSTGGTPVCSTTAQPTTMTQGRFRVPLSSACIASVQQNPELWLEATVDGTAMGRSKLGAVPYAVESRSAAECLPNNKAAKLDVAGDASLTVHSNTDTPTSGSNMLALRTGKATPKDVLSVDNNGNVAIVSPNPLSWYPTDRVVDLGGSSVLAFSKYGIDSYLYVTQNVYQNSAAQFVYRQNDEASYYMQYSGQHRFAVAPAGSAGNVASMKDAMVIDVTGNVGIGTYTPTAKLHVAGNIYATGTITPGSSRGLKERIRDLAPADALAAIRALHPTRFYYKADKTDEHLGFIAEDVPALLATRDRKGVDPMDVAAVLTKVVQEQHHEIHVLKKERLAMEGRLMRLESALGSMRSVRNVQ